MNAQELKSPNGNFKMIFALENDGTPTYQLFHEKQRNQSKSKLGLELQKDKKSLLNDFKLVNEVRNTFDETWKPFGVGNRNPQPLQRISINAETK